MLSKPDGDVDLGIEEGDCPKRKNAKHSESCPVDIPCGGHAHGVGNSQ